MDIFKEKKNIWKKQAAQLKLDLKHSVFVIPSQKEEEEKKDIFYPDSFLQQ